MLLLLLLLHLSICTYFSKHFHMDIVSLVPHKIPARHRRKWFSPFIHEETRLRKVTLVDKIKHDSPHPHEVYSLASWSIIIRWLCLPFDRNTALMFWELFLLIDLLHWYKKHSCNTLHQAWQNFSLVFFTLVIDRQKDNSHLSLKIFIERNRPEAQEGNRLVWIDEWWWQGNVPYDLKAQSLNSQHYL